MLLAPGGSAHRCVRTIRRRGQCDAERGRVYVALLTGQDLLERVRLCLHQYLFSRSFAQPFPLFIRTGPSYYYDAKRSALCCPRRRSSYCKCCRRPACLQGVFALCTITCIRLPHFLNACSPFHSVHGNHWPIHRTIHRRLV